MGWGMIPKPGEMRGGVEVGPCLGECEHPDCGATRTMAATVCEICHKEIGYSTKYYFRGDGGMVHAICAWEVRTVAERPKAAT